jgi:hypothetical protein
MQLIAQRGLPTIPQTGTAPTAADNAPKTPVAKNAGKGKNSEQ